MARFPASEPVDSPTADTLERYGIDSAETLHRILKLSNKLMAPFSANLERQHKISINEFRLLMLIGRQGSAASHELAEMTGVSIMSVSRAVSALEKHGRITVEQDPANRRRKTLRLTPEGERLFAIMRPQTDLVSGYLMSALRPDEVMAFDRFLETLIATLEATDAQGRSLFMERTRPPESEAD
jgi:DNA-binding MarR family transcriptional regulator